MGALHPELIKSLGLNGPVFLFEISQAVVLDGQLPRFGSLSKFPESRRDLALLVDENIGFESIRAVAKKQGGEFLKAVTLFDVYQGKGVEPGQKSLALGLTLQHPSRTLNDDEINGAVDSVITALKTKFGASLRE
jgi:phenylalanyl-tRNA synthetase beta chain